MRVLITGIAGFGGSGLAGTLVQHGHQVTGVDIVAPSEAHRLVEIVDHMTYLWKAVKDLTASDIDGHDVLCDFAGQADVPMGYSSPEWTCSRNLSDLVHLLELVKRCHIKKVIYPGSGTIFGRPEYLPIDESHPATPANPYSATKACAEVICWAYHRCYGIPVVVLRNGVVYGPKMRKEIFIYKFLSNAIRSLPIVIEGGEQTRDPCYVTDTMEAWLRIIEAPESKVVGRSFQISSGQEYSVMAIAQRCIEATRSSVPIKTVDYRPGEKGMRECFDISRARSMLGYEPRISLDEGLKLTARWVEKEVGRVRKRGIAR